MGKAVLVVVVALAAVGALLAITQATAQQNLVGGGTLVVIGLPLLVLSRIHLGRAFSVMPKATTLVTTGIYSRIPHPMFAFLDVALLGVIIAFRQSWLVGLWLALVGLHIWASAREARLLERAFGDSYRRYRAQTWW